ncbi:MAG: amidohydrolase [Chlorobi bacterium]|nr:amidohydrolase [Chlorobiota bacterium]
MLDKILDEAKAIQEEIVKHRRTLHQSPETGMNLPNTSEYVKDELTKMGYEPQSVGTSGVMAVIGKGNGKTVLLRADMDALPIPEDSGEPFSSTNGNMHACGHDMHTSMLLGAAKLLKKHEVEIEGTVKLLFQPGEEVFKGAAEMIEHGVLENPKVDIAMMLHVGTGMPLEPGTFSKPVKGPFTATSDTFRIEIKGKGGHGAMPETAVDPLVPAANILLALDSIKAKEIPATEPVVLTTGQVHGGTAPNIIANSAFLEGTLRTFSKENREKIKNRIVEIANGIASAYRVQAEVTFRNGCPSVMIDEDAAQIFSETAAEIVGENALIPFDTLLPGGKVMASEDFAFYTEHVPGVMSFLSAGDARKGFVYPPHHPKTRFSEEPLYKGASAYAGFALKFINSEY